ncbi:MAG: hypothetical protein ACU0BS_02955 [Hasllibacter sp.]
MERDPTDPKGLIREAYRIEGIGKPECRSIFLDWALSVDATPAAIAAMLERHGGDEGAGGHPMTEVLREGLEAAPKGRRGGRAARVGGSSG